jgi:hypothetical protein
MTSVFFEFHCLRLNKRWFVNPAHVLSFYEADWGGTPAKTALEVKGQQGYGNHTIYVRETVDEVAAKLRVG